MTWRTSACVAVDFAVEGRVDELDDNGGVCDDFLADAEEDEGVADVEAVCHERRGTLRWFSCSVLDRMLVWPWRFLL